MGLDFDVFEFCKKLRQNRPPPYQCPLEKCDKVYKSLCGLQYHLVHYDHDNPTPATPAVANHRKKGRGRAAVPTGDIALQSPPKEALTFAEAQKVVQFEIDGKISRIPIDQPLPIMSLGRMAEDECRIGKALASGGASRRTSCELVDDYNERVCDAPPRPNAYIRFIEKSAEELDGEVEYDVDEEDTAWLAIINKTRRFTVDTLELLMDRLEKESYFQASQNGQQTAATVDEDAVCCICMDGECQNTNVILFCDMCNLAVHQDCYGVPYIPEGQWLCRRCLQSPSRLVNCVLCPNTGGAFKQTDQGTWAHVVCALWIPEVRFANTVFLEPIDSIEMIPAARWKLQCMVCKQRSVGACIQCHKSNCYSAFHVTCAQQAGLYMKMEAAGAGRDPSQPVQVAKMAYCDAHTPAHILQERRAQESEGDTKSNDLTAIRQKGREKIKQARRVLAMKRTWAPVVLVPTLPADRVAEVAALAPGAPAARAQLMKRLLAYWTLKRHSRNGVPLLRRLQSLTSNHGTRGIQDGTVNVRELCNQLKYWQRIRQDLERARLLCELVRKRERLKAEYTRVWERCVLHSLRPERAALHKLLRMLRQRDASDIFTEPVDLHEVRTTPTYTRCGPSAPRCTSCCACCASGTPATSSPSPSTCTRYALLLLTLAAARARRAAQAAAHAAPAGRQRHLHRARRPARGTHYSALAAARARRAAQAAAHAAPAGRQRHLHRARRPARGTHYSYLHSLRPERAALHKLLRMLRQRDASDIFTEPVDLHEVRTTPTYTRCGPSAPRCTSCCACCASGTPATSSPSPSTCTRYALLLLTLAAARARRAAQAAAHAAPAGRQRHLHRARRPARGTHYSYLHSLRPERAALHKLLRMLRQRDASDIFTEPVDLHEVRTTPTYTRCGPSAPRCTSCCACCASGTPATSSPSPSTCTRYALLLLTLAAARARRAAQAAAHAAPAGRQRHLHRARRPARGTHYSYLHSLRPERAALHKLLRMLRQRDASDIFTEPVDLHEVRTTPTYTRCGPSAPRCTSCCACCASGTPATSSPSPSTCTSTIVKHPMDLSTMGKKLDRGAYSTIDDMEADFKLMIDNCLTYNNKDTVFYKAGVKMREQCMPLFRAARRDVREAGLQALCLPPTSPTTPGPEILRVPVVPVPLGRGAVSAALPVDRDPLVRASENLRRRDARTAAYRRLAVRGDSPSLQKTLMMKTSLLTAPHHQRQAARSHTPTSGSETPVPGTTAERTHKLATPEKSPVKQPETTPITGLGLMGALRKPTLLVSPSTVAGPPKSFGSDASLPTLSASLGRSSLESSPKKKGRGRPRKQDKDKSTSSPDLFRSAQGGEGKSVSTPVPASFLQYRGPPGEVGSDSDLALSRSSSSSSAWSQSCSSCTHYEDGDASDHSCSMSSTDGVEGQDLQLQKLRGYPWYPALIIDPKIPKGFIYNGVPLPVPPQDVLNLKKNHAHEPILYLVLFFDVKRTWQWLPPNKLEPLGLDKSVDQAKLVESRKPTDRKAVKKAYGDAMQFRKQVHGDDK
ncbi:hypothetical protein HW555_005535 [Spodoptera exigua]|uniref:Peregrin n=1 Tax=Spodoptera exigua TaxID=7107 RepID=A0A835GIX2_SPOEX|nr:hypothetical protein HW555_005535 [Spodoptera exigua]